jgi:starch synthase
MASDRKSPPPVVVHLASELWPYARTGGLAEAVRGIARHQWLAGVNTSVFVPFYARIREGFPELEPFGEAFAVQLGGRRETVRLHRACENGGPQAFFVEHDGFFGRPGLYGEPGGSYDDNHLRFALLCRAALMALPALSPAPAILHLHDWHAALAAVYLRTELAADPFYASLAVVLTVHNAGYQGHYGTDVLPDLGLDPALFTPDVLEWYGRVNLLKGGLAFSDLVTTVSATHAHELRTPVGGFGLHDTFVGLHDRFVGILNAIDYTVWNPETDASLEATFGPDDLSGKAACKAWLQDMTGLETRPDVPLFGMSARLVEQKGLDIVLLADMIPRLEAQWIFLGEGEPRYTDALLALAQRAPDRIAVRFDFSEEREHQLLAAADFLLMPSLYEPCGLTQMRAQRYGALPVARRVGGLADTVEDRVTGVVFDEFTPQALEDAVQYAMALYRNRREWEWHVREAMARDFSWPRSVERYAEVYRRALRRRAHMNGT